MAAAAKLTTAANSPTDERLDKVIDLLTEIRDELITRPKSGPILMTEPAQVKKQK